ncbi:MAG: tetratricopeptide repeat protein [Rhodospirillales bacterium]|nr:tetratricopeptide repeat protein [Rhodospirillales bacterium]
MSDDLDAVRRAAREAHDRGDFQAAIERLSTVINILGPNSRAAVEDQVTLARYLSAVADYDAALSVLSHAERHLPVDAGLLVDKGIVLARLERFEEAEAVLQSALAAGADDPDVLDALAQVSARLGKTR